MVGQVQPRVMDVYVNAGDATPTASATKTHPHTAQQQHFREVVNQQANSEGTVLVVYKRRKNKHSITISIYALLKGLCAAHYAYTYIYVFDFRIPFYIYARIPCGSIVDAALWHLRCVCVCRRCVMLSSSAVLLDFVSTC